MLALQELKARKEGVDFQLSTLFPNNKFCVDYSEGGYAGAIITMLSNLKILD